MITASFLAGSDLSTHQYKGVIMHSVANEVTIAGEAGKAIGILQNAPADGEEAVVCVLGVCPAKVKQNSLSAGDHLSVVATTFELEQSDGAGDHVVAILLADSSSTAGTTAEILPVLVCHWEAYASDA